MNSKSRELAEQIIQYYTTHKHAGHSYACCSTQSERNPRYLMSSKLLAMQWFHYAHLDVNTADVYSPAEMHQLVDVNDKRPLIIDHFVVSKTLQELLKDIVELEAAETALKKQVSSLSYDASIFKLANEDLLKEVEVWRKLPEILKKLPITERLKLLRNPVEVIDGLRKKIESESKAADNKG